MRASATRPGVGGGRARSWLGWDDRCSREKSAWRRRSTSAIGVGSHGVTARPPIRGFRLSHGDDGASIGPGNTQDQHGVLRERLGLTPRGRAVQDDGRCRPCACTLTWQRGDDYRPDRRPGISGL